jgi:hypothetical protein
MTINIGAVLSQANAGIDPGEIRRYAVEAEAAGFKHLIVYDHVLGATPERLGPGPFGSFPGPPYTHTSNFHEVLTLMSHLAAVTSTIEFVSSVLILPQRQAQLAAKQIATVDLLSGGIHDPSSVELHQSRDQVVHEHVGTGIAVTRKPLVGGRSNRVSSDTEYVSDADPGRCPQRNSRCAPVRRISAEARRSIVFANCSARGGTPSNVSVPTGMLT